jgi:hypothetical protein
MQTLGLTIPAVDWPVAPQTAPMQKSERAKALRKCADLRLQIQKQ